MCEPKHSFSPADAIGIPVDLAVGAALAAGSALGTRVGRRVAAVIVVSVALYVLSLIEVTVPAVVVVGLAASTLASTTAAVAFWRRSRGRAPLLHQAVFPQGRPLPPVVASRPRVTVARRSPSEFAAIEEARPQFDEVTLIARRAVDTEHLESQKVVRHAARVNR